MRTGHLPRVVERAVASAYCAARVAAREGGVLVFVFALLGGLIPAFAQPAADGEYVLRSNGIMCVRAPCPTVDATEVATSQVTRVTGIDVRART